MKIGIEAQRIFRENKHGMDYVVLQEILQLQQIDKENEYFVFVKPGPDRCVKSTPNVHIVELSMPSYPLWEQVALPRAARRCGVELLHCTSNTAPLQAGMPLVLTLHDIIFLEKATGSNGSLYQRLGRYYRRFVVPRILPHCRRIITVSEFERRNIIATLDVEPERVAMIYNAANEWFHPTDDPRHIYKRYMSQPGYIFFLGNTDPKKNTERTLQAYARYLERSQAKRPLLVADLERSSFDTIVERNGIGHIAGHVTLAGYIANADLPYVYASAFAYLYTSLRESFGIPLLEAMATGTPVVTSNTSSMPEVAGHGAILVDPTNADAIASELLRLETDEAHYRQQKDYGIDRARQFSWTGTARQLLSLYRKVVVVTAALMMSFNAVAQSESADTVARKPTTLGQKLLKPLKWIARNWSDYDPSYSLPAFYNWAVHVQNTSSQEWLNMESPEGMKLDMHSKMSNRLGPYFGYQWLFYGTTVDLNTIGKPASKGKNEFTLSINSNLVNIDIIRRRTGGDFVVNKLEFDNPSAGHTNLLEEDEQFDFGEFIKNSLTGININYFTNHRRYSNPAAFSNGAVQLKSVGTPIVGLGYTHQKVESDASNIFTAFATVLASLVMPYDFDFDTEIERLDQLYSTDPEGYKKEMGQLLDQTWGYMGEFPPLEKMATALFTNRIPITTHIDDWHLQLGYAYNLVFSRRLLLGLSAVVSPGIKRVRADNKGSITWDIADELSSLLKKHNDLDLAPDYFRYNYDRTRFNVNAFLRASLTFNHNRWRAGLNFNFNNYFFRDDGMKVRNGYGSLTTYVGYCFGRKREYRHDGEHRRDYIMAALTKKQIEEMNDVMPSGNLAPDSTVAGDGRLTRRYHDDEFTLNIHGCDLVRGSDGRYGWLEVADGYITPGQDSEQRVKKGMLLELDSDGAFTVEAGHKGSFRAGNWWKSQVDIHQTPNTWYPEQLHYALRGKLTLHLRGRIFGTRRPVTMVIDDFCLNHGSETQSFSQVAVRSFASIAPYSIEGRVGIDGRTYRVFIEQKRRGRHTDVYVSRIQPSWADWMSTIDGRRPVSTISIPGTHDAGTATLSESPIVSSALTQLFSVESQLTDGVRAFDLRLKKDMRYGHTFNARESFDSTMVAWDRFLHTHPSECIVALVGSDGGGRWDNEMAAKFMRIIRKYPHRFVERFDARTPLDSVRGKIMVIRRQESCPFGKLLLFEDNAVFSYDCFQVEDVYKEHKTWKKIKIVEQNIRRAYENQDPGKWFITFNSVAWSPRRHTPYSYAWGGKARNIRKPLNKALNEVLEMKDYCDFGIVFLDFYNDHGEQSKLVESIIESNIRPDE